MKDRDKLLIEAMPEVLDSLMDCCTALEDLGTATAPFISGAISSGNPKVCNACASASRILAQARIVIVNIRKL